LNRYLSTTALLFVGAVGFAQQQLPAFQPVPEIRYSVHSDFFELPRGMNFGEAAGVAVAANGHIFLFQRVQPMLTEYTSEGKFIRSLGEGLFVTPHGLRIDPEGNIWTTDVGSHVVLKLSPDGHVLMVLGHKNQDAEGTWLFNRPADVGFDIKGNVYIADGYGNSRIIKFDKAGRYLTTWGKYGTEPGEFRLPHAIVIDRKGQVYVADRENARIQVFNEDGKFIRQETGVGYPYGLSLLPNGHLIMADGGYDRLVELDEQGKILGALGEPGHLPGQFAWAHAVAVGPDGKLYVADTLNWRFQVFTPMSEVEQSRGMSRYIPTVRMFNDFKPSNGWTPHLTGLAK
jgi:peptidylamidoglycolate lyase